MVCVCCVWPGKDVQSKKWPKGVTVNIHTLDTAENQSIIRVGGGSERQEDLKFYRLTQLLENILFGGLIDLGWYLHF